MQVSSLFLFSFLFKTTNSMVDASSIYHPEFEMLWFCTYNYPMNDWEGYSTSVLYRTIVS